MEPDCTKCIKMIRIFIYDVRYPERRVCRMRIFLKKRSDCPHSADIHFPAAQPPLPAQNGTPRMPIGQPEGGNSPGTPLPFHTKTEHQFLSHGLKTVHRTVFLTAFRVPFAFPCKKQAPRRGTCFLVARQGLVCVFARE